MAYQNANGHGRRMPQPVSKVLYQRDQRVSPLRALELAAGIGLGAWGAGRSRMVGAALGHGLKAATSANNARAVEALRLAQAAQGALRRGTAPGERTLRQIQQVNRAVQAVPRPLRGEIGLAAGLLLAGNSMPLRHTTYKPLPMSYPTVQRVW